MTGEELSYIQEAFRKNWISPFGENIEAFQQQLSGYFDTRVLLLNSGTAAIHMALAALGVEPGDKVVVSTFTFAGAVFPIRYLGAEPVFIDSEPRTWNMDPQLLRDYLLKARQQQQLPKCVLLVHLYGVPAAIEEIVTICEEFGLPLIEDAADALGATVNDKPVGTFGAMGIVSFNGNKIITTSGGGALLSSTQKWLDHADRLSNQAREDAPFYLHRELGYNYRLSNISAGIGRGQFKALEQRIQQRRENFNFYKEALREISNIEYPLELPGARSNRWLSVFSFPDNKEIRDLTITALKEQGIESRPLWKPMHEQPVFQSAEMVLNGTASRLFEQGICLPSGSSLTKDQLEEIASILRKTLNPVS